MYKDANGHKVKNNTFYKVKGEEDYKVIFVGNLNQRQLPKERRLPLTAFQGYIPIKNPQEYAESLKSQAYNLSRAERLIRNNLEAKSNSSNITLIEGW